MTLPYRIVEGSSEERELVEREFEALAQLPPGLRHAAVTAWVTAWRSSPYAEFDRMPYSLSAPDYPLPRHVRDVTVGGLLLSKFAAAQWQVAVRDDVLVCALVLHDVDKPLLFMPSERGLALSPAARQYPHGVLGAALLRDLGFSDPVTTIVATHSPSTPDHSLEPEAWILHYADFFATDYVMRGAGGRPYYVRAPAH